MAFLLLNFILLSCQQQTPTEPTIIRVAFFDTAHCLEYLTKQAPKNIIFKLENSAYTQAEVCALELSHPARHGDRVVAIFLRNLTPASGTQEKALEIHLYGLFNPSGESPGSHWNHALESARKLQVQLIYSAVATKEVIKWDAEIALVVASGQWGGRVKKNATFYPHELIKNSAHLRERSLVIGSYQMDTLHQEAWRDQSLLYSELIDYSFAQSESAAKELGVQGSSHALAIAAGRSLSICRHVTENFKKMRQCLQEHALTVSTQDGVVLKQY